MKKEGSNYFCFTWHWAGFSWNKLYLILHVILYKEKRLGQYSENSNWLKVCEIRPMGNCEKNWASSVNCKTSRCDEWWTINCKYVKRWLPSLRYRWHRKVNHGIEKTNRSGVSLRAWPHFTFLRAYLTLGFIFHYSCIFLSFLDCNILKGTGCVFLLLESPTVPHIQCPGLFRTWNWGRSKEESPKMDTMIFFF